MKADRAYNTVTLQVNQCHILLNIPTTIKHVHSFQSGMNIRNSSNISNLLLVYSSCDTRTNCSLMHSVNDLLKVTVQPCICTYYTTCMYLYINSLLQLKMSFPTQKELQKQLKLTFLSYFWAIVFIQTGLCESRQEDSGRVRYSWEMTQAGLEPVPPWAIYMQPVCGLVHQSSDDFCDKLFNLSVNH